MQLLENIKWYRSWKGGTWYKIYLKHPKTGKRSVIWDHNGEPVYFKIRYKIVKIEHYHKKPSNPKLT